MALWLWLRPPGHMSAHWHSFTGKILPYSQTAQQRNHEELCLKWLAGEQTSFSTQPGGGRTFKCQLPELRLIDWEKRSEVSGQVQVNTNILFQLLPVIWNIWSDVSSRRDHTTVFWYFNTYTHMMWTQTVQTLSHKYTRRQLTLIVSDGSLFLHGWSHIVLVTQHVVCPPKYWRETDTLWQFHKTLSSQVETGGVTDLAMPHDVISLGFHQVIICCYIKHWSLFIIFISVVKVKARSNHLL